MMIRTKIFHTMGAIVGMFFILMMLGGCGTTSGTAKPNPELSAQYLQKGRDLEKQGDLAAAQEQYKLALTADPKNEAALQDSMRLTDELAKQADARYDLGMKYHRQGKYALARTQFLIALKFQPEHPGASRMLVSRQPEIAPEYVLHEVQTGESLSIIANKYYGDYKKYDLIARFNNITDVTRVKPGQRIKIPNIAGTAMPAAQTKDDLSDAEFVLHTIQPGQSISKLAQIYYGDYKQFHRIAQYNKMDDATQVKVGDKVKIPKIAGQPFNQPASEPRQMAATPVQDALESKAPGPESKLTAVSDTLEPNQTVNSGESGNEQILAYRSAGIALYNEGKYEDAIFELHKSSEAMPKDKQTHAYLSKAYFESGKSLLNQNEYDSAKEAFESALQFDPNCTECKKYIEKSKTGPLIAYRAKGIDHFNRNQFGDAISVLHQYLQVQPADADARTYLGKAYFQKALIDYNKADYLIAKKEFESALTYDSQCEKCVSYINQSLESHKAAHYDKGLNYFGRQELEEAINEWETVYALDPGYKDVDKNLKKARALMEKLEQIKKSRQQ